MIENQKLLYAAKTNNFEQVKESIEKGADINFSNELKNKGNKLKKELMRSIASKTKKKIYEGYTHEDSERRSYNQRYCDVWFLIYKIADGRYLLERSLKTYIANITSKVSYALVNVLNRDIITNFLNAHTTQQEMSWEDYYHELDHSDIPESHKYYMDLEYRDRQYFRRCLNEYNKFLIEDACEKLKLLQKELICLTEDETNQYRDVHFSICKRDDDTKYRRIYYKR
jgi:hypothetical protein